MLRSTGLSNLLHISFKKSRFSSTQLNTGFILLDIFKAIGQPCFFLYETNSKNWKKEHAGRAEKQHLLAKSSQTSTRSLKEIANHLYEIYPLKRKKAVRRREVTH